MIRTLSLFLLFLALVGCSGSKPELSRYITEIPAESEQARQARHEAIAQRRAGPVVLVHRGAVSLATENTLEAYAASMDYGADGCEIDIRQTADGILVLFHDDYLDRLSTTFGVFDQLTYDELRGVIPKDRYGTVTKMTTLPTLAAVFTLARQRNMLLHLDIKTPGLDKQIIKLLDDADIWDHVVWINDYNSEFIRKDPRYQPLEWVRSLYQDRLDVDPEQCLTFVPPPGKMVILDDPRVMAKTLGRKPYRHVPMTSEIYDLGDIIEVEETTVTPSPSRGIYIREKDKDQYTEEDLALLLEVGPENDWKVLATNNAEDEARIERILERAWAARQLGQLEEIERDTVDQLVFVMVHRSLHPDWMYHGVDGAEAAKALGRHGYKEVVPFLIEKFKTVDPKLITVRDPQFTENPLSFTDWRIKEAILVALGDIQTPEAKKHLLLYIQMSKEEVEYYAIDYHIRATEALMKHSLDEDELRMVLSSENTGVRGTAILYVLDRGTADQYKLLKGLYPWVKGLPRGKGFRE
jgi:glycerophosphoryl diester phosphodiesterase family protein